MPRTTNEPKTRRGSEERITKRVVIKTDSTYLVRKKRSINQGAAEYKWSCELVGVETTGKETPLDYIDRVEFLLHETFKNPLHVVTHPPFKIYEEGWGAFDMRIRVFFVGADESTPYEIQHDLNFVKEHYEVRHNIIIRNPCPELYRALLPSRVVDTVTDIARRHQDRSSVSDETPPRTRPITTPETSTSRKRSRSGDRSDEDSKSKREALDTKSQSNHRQSRPLPDEFSSSPIPSFKTTPARKEIDIGVLVKRLSDMDEDGILKVVWIVESYRTDDTYVDESEKGKYEFDLYTLPREAVIEIYQFLYEEEGSNKKYEYYWSEREENYESDVDVGYIGANSSEGEEASEPTKVSESPSHHPREDAEVEDVANEMRDDDLDSQSPETPKRSSDDETQPAEENGIETEPMDSEDEYGTVVDNVPDVENDEQQTLDDNSGLEDEIEQILQDDGLEEDIDQILQDEGSDESDNEGTEKSRSDEDTERFWAQEGVKDARPMGVDNNDKIDELEEQEREEGELASDPEDGEVR